MEYNFFKSFKPFLVALMMLPLLYLKADPSDTTFEFNFSKDHQGWIADFSDYPVGAETFFELAWGWENLPNKIPLSVSPGDPSKFTKGLYLSGNNHSDDLFMFIKHQIKGLKPNTLYQVAFDAILASRVPMDAVGIGGSPGESVFVKIGASTEEPNKVAIEGHYFLNVDKGNQSTGGKNAVVIGDLANPLVDPENPQYLPKPFIPGIPLEVQTDEKGQLWVFFGTDSGFEGTSKFYILSIVLQLTQSS